METYAGLRQPQLSDAILPGPPAPFLQPGIGRLQEVAAQGGGRKEPPDAGNDARMEDWPVGDQAARLGTTRPACCTVAAVAPAAPRPKS